MDTQTRHALKQDKLILAAQTGADWLQDNRTNAIRLAIAVVVVLAAAIAGLVVYQHRKSAADLALGEALDIYSAPLIQPGQTAPPGETTFASAAARSESANRKFVDIAKHYGMLRAGKNARYFAGITAMEMGQNGAAETDLKAVADSGDKDLAALAKLALASLYGQTNRGAQAVPLYRQLIAKPTATVPASSAQLQLAALYETTNPAEAKRIYAQLKNDHGIAGEIATQKMGTK